MPDHDQVHEDLGGYVLGVLEPEEVAAFEAHLAGCDPCRREVAELSGLPGLLSEAAEPVDVPPDLEDRTFAAIEREAAAPAAAPAPRRDRARRRLDLRKVLAVAAAVVVVGAGVAVVREATQPDVAAAEVIELEAPAGRSGRATARVRDGTIEMQVEGLPVPPPGYFFECWLVAAQGDTPERPNRVSVGTFTVDADGRANVRWDFDADTAKFPRMGVTLEPDDGNPIQTTDRVLGATRLL